MPERAMFCFSCSTALRRAVVGVRHHRAAAEAFLGHLGPAHRRRPQRLHPRAVDAGRQEELVVDLLQHVQVFRVEDVAVGVLDHDAQRVAQAAQVLLVGQVVLDVRLALRNHLLEARVEPELRRRDVAEHHGDDRADDDHRQPVVEHQALEQVAGFLVEVRELADHRHLVEIVGDGCHDCSCPCARCRSARRVSVTATPRGPTSASRPSPASAMPVSGIGCLRRRPG